MFTKYYFPLTEGWGACSQSTQQQSANSTPQTKPGHRGSLIEFGQIEIPQKTPKKLHCSQVGGILRAYFHITFLTLHAFLIPAEIAIHFYSPILLVLHYPAIKVNVELFQSCFSVKRF